MYQFSYVKPASVADAAKVLAGDDEAKVVAGGMTLIPTMKQRLAAPSQLVDLGRIGDLSGISVDGSALVIKAMTTHATVAASDVVKAHIPALAALAANIGDPQVRNRGTIGGSVANDDPAADYPSAVLALGATVHTSKRTITADDFFIDTFTTALDADELITAISFPKPKRAAYQKFPNPASRYAMVGVFVAETSAGVRVAVTGAGPSVFRWSEAEAALSGNFSAAAVAGLAMAEDRMNADMHGSAAYRANLCNVMLARAVSAIA